MVSTCGPSNPAPTTAMREIQVSPIACRAATFENPHASPVFELYISIPFHSSAFRVAAVLAQLPNATARNGTILFALAATRG